MKNVSAKEPFGKAVRYLRNHWETLQVYVSNPAAPIDNNETEPLMKQVAVAARTGYSSAASRQAVGQQT